MDQAAARDWARDEFGGSELGDLRLTARVVQTAAGALCRPRSTISGTFGRSAAAEGAFRLVENKRVCVNKLADASHAAAARRCDEHTRVVVPIDSTSLLIRDPQQLRGLGPLSAIGHTLRGIQSFHALAVDPAGATLGIVGRQFWLRQETATKSKGAKNTQPLETRESYRWVTMLESVQAQMQQHAPNSEPWFQLDRGGDSWVVIDRAVERGLMLTVRANQNRLLARKGTRSTRLFQAIRRVAPTGVLQLDVPEGHKRKARHASLTLRCARFVIPVPSLKKEQRRRTIGVVMVTEKDAPVDGSPKIEWVLLTTHDVNSAADATEVVRAYTRRWRIEEFHRTWKNGVCGIESTRLRAYDHIQRWAIIMGSVAARIEQIKFTSRTTPELSAEEFFTRDEIDAVILLTSKHRKIPYLPGQTPTMGEVTRWISYLGGYMGSKNSLPPGATVIARGLERVQAAAELLEAQRQLPKPRRARGK